MFAFLVNRFSFLVKKGAAAALAILITALPAISHANRITGSADPAKRCMAVGVPLEKCESYRKKALAVGCISQSEYDVLVSYGSYPTCSVLKADSGPEMLDGWCACGCLHPDSMISTISSMSGQETETRAGVVANNRFEFDLVNLLKEASLDRLTFGRSSIRVSTTGPEAKPLIVLHTEDGRTLKVTEKHPILLADGRMVQAKSLMAGDLVLTQQGRAIALRSVTLETYQGDVVNFSTNGESELEHVIFAEGLAVGDLFWQSSLEDRMNQIIIRQ